MKGNLVVRFFVVAAVTLFALWFMVPTFRWWALPSDQLAMWEKSLEAPAAVISQTNVSMRSNAMSATTTATDLASRESRVASQIEEERALDKLRKLKAKVMKLGLDLQGGMHIVLQADLTDMKTEKEKQDAIQRALEIIRNRIDRFGVSEPSINRQGEDRIVVQLPGIRDPKRAQELLVVEGTLNLTLVDDALSKPENFEDYKKGILKASVVLPEDEEVLFVWQKNPDTAKMEATTPLVVKRTGALTGAYLKAAEVTFSQFGEPQVDFELKPEGARIFLEFTAGHIGKRLAIELDRKIRSAPVIRDKLSDRGVISGSFTLDEARDLALILRAGALPVKMEVVEQRVVGPSLGQDSINAGIKAGWIAIIMIFGFMMLYYKGAGVIATFATILNMFLTLGFLTGLGFTLTLPGIAGLILTIGMAVDANVIIFERIREELRAGQTPGTAVEAGYDRANITVLDANLTTMIIAAILFQFGTGSIKGFAATLFIGIGANLFTGVYCTRLFYMFLSQKFGIRRLSI